MSYHSTTRTILKTAPKTLGVRLGRLAVRKSISVMEIAEITGASRTTIYSWFAGNTVTNAYKKTVADLIAQLQQRK